MLHYFLYEVDGAAFDAHAAAPVTGQRTMAMVCQSPAEKFVDELLTDAAEDAAEADGGPLREFKNLLSEFAGEFSNSKKRDEKLLSVALEKAEIPHRRIRVGANRITLYAVTDRHQWKGASNVSWSAQYELQTAAETRGEASIELQTGQDHFVQCNLSWPAS